MKVYPITNKYFDSMSYVATIEKDCIIIDPSFEGQKIIDFITDNNLNIVAILLTHGHNDHIYSVEQLLNTYDCKVYCSKQCALDIKDPYLNLSYNEEYDLTFDCKPTVLTEGQHTIEKFEFKVVDVPGHSLGCIIFEFDDLMFTGDFLFKRAVGTVKYHNSSYDLMITSIEKFKTTYENVEKTVYPGHREATTIQTELKTNPFLRRPKSIKFLN